MTHFSLFSSSCLVNLKNCLYPHSVTVCDEASLREAVKQDYVAVAYQGNYRVVQNFLRSDCLALDCDNDHSDDPANWLTPEKLMNLFPDTTVGIHFSRHHNLPKGARSARPRFHCLFRIEEMTDPAAYKRLKERMQACCPYFDTKAMDSARCFFGTENPEVLFRAGTITLNECLDMYYPGTDPSLCAAGNADIIPEGRRNNTMHDFAVRVLKRCGLTDEARQLYADESKKCVPPLERQELQSIWNSAVKFYTGTIATDPNYIPPVHFDWVEMPDEAPEQPPAPEAAPAPRAEQASPQPAPAAAPIEEPDPLSGWMTPIPFARDQAEPFPIDALPEDFADYAKAVAESTQTPVDMAGTAALSIMSLCLQGRYRIQGKRDWVEPLNTYALAIATPSERKSAVLNLMIKPVNNYEIQFNIANAELFTRNRMEKHALEIRQKNLEEKKAKGQASEAELTQIVIDITKFKEVHPLRLYVDDITTEKLTSIISANNGQAAMVSSEGGIFDILAGTYSKSVNIDVMLKAYSGDTIRVDRVGRPSESIMNPALTVFLMVQPNVISRVLANTTFQGRGLTARFLYCVPASMVGSRRFDSTPIPEEVKQKYYAKITDLLSNDIPEDPALITLTPEARQELSAFAQEIETRLVTDCAKIADWTGKLVGNVLRISGLLCRSRLYLAGGYAEDYGPLEVSGETMRNAIRLGRYFLSHAKVTFDIMPAKPLHMSALHILKMLKEKKLTEFDRRTAMRHCSVFKTIEDIQPVLDFLEDYGYIFAMPTSNAGRPGRPALPRYCVNRRVLEQDLDSLLAA